MEQFLAWMSSTTGIITTFTALLGAILLLIKNTREVIISPLKWIMMKKFDWLHKERDNELKGIEDKLEQIENKSNESDAELIKTLRDLSEQIKISIDEVNCRIDDNERDRIRAEIFRYGRMARQGEHISTEEWRHIQDIYYKYHEVLHGNGQITEEYGVIRKHYESQYDIREGE